MPTIHISILFTLLCSLSATASAQGKNIAQNYGEAAKLFRLAAAQGNISAQYNLGLMLRNGGGITQDYGEAFKLYKLAADSGHPEAQSEIADMYYKGEGVPQNYERAAAWHDKSARLGNPKSQHLLAGLYVRGEGLEHSFVSAYVWFSMAAIHDYDDGDFMTAKFMRDVTSNELKLGGSDQLANAQNLATRCFESGYKDCD